jgi:hypothetical protein
MNNFLAMSHRAAKRATIWFSYLSVLLSLAGLFMVAQGSLNVDLSLSDTQAINPYFAVLVSGFVLTVVFYVVIFSIFFVVFAVSVPVLRSWSMIKLDKNSQ